jgi:glutaredoxin-like protein NrdH
MALEQHIVHVPGSKRGGVMLYALSTCGWCRKTKNLLDDLGVEYDYVYVDQLDGESKREALDRVRQWNPRTSFPTMVIDGQAVIGYQDESIREKLGRG